VLITANNVAISYNFLLAMAPMESSALETTDETRAVFITNASSVLYAMIKDIHLLAARKVQNTSAKYQQLTSVTLKTPVRLGPQYAKLPSCILSFTPSFLLRNQASILIFSSTLNKDTILLLRSITRPRSSYVITSSRLNPSHSPSHSYFPHLAS
jgi:hypothetical protein